MGKFSQGFLSDVGRGGQNFLYDRPATDSQGRAVDPARRGGLLGGMNQLYAGAVGRDTSTSEEKITQAMASISPTDPQRMAKMYAVMIEHGTPQQKIAASTKLQEMGEKSKAQTQLTNLRNSLKARAKVLGLPEAMRTTIDNAGLEQLKDLTKDFRTQEFSLVNEKRQQPMLDKVAEGYGLDSEDVQGLSFEQITKMGEMGEGTDSKRFEQQDGKVVQLPVRGGKVFYKGPEDTEGKWVTPQDVNVTEEDPNVTTTIQRVETMGKEIDNTILKGFDSNYTSALSIKEQAIENNRALELVDEGILAGKFSGIVAEADKIVSALTGRPTKNTTQNTVELMRQRAAKVLQNIKALGAGSGVSNTDLAFMKEMMAQDLSLVTTQDVLRLLILERQILERKESSFDEDLDFMQEIDALDQTRRDYFTNKTRIPEMYQIQEDDIKGIDLSTFDLDTQAFLTEYLNQ
tara:strand:- start:3514 stop:4893 length:1380 start_codon:yes stop_codon:yes gene_type:complete